jgi:hypothetical protein
MKIIVHSVVLPFSLNKFIQSFNKLTSVNQLIIGERRQLNFKRSDGVPKVYLLA